MYLSGFNLIFLYDHPKSARFLILHNFLFSDFYTQTWHHPDPTSTKVPKISAAEDTKRPEIAQSEVGFGWPGKKCGDPLAWLVALQTLFCRILEDEEARLKQQSFVNEYCK